MIQTDTLTTILSVPAVVAIVTLLKSFGVAGKWALLAALVVAVALNVADTRGPQAACTRSSSGLLTGLAAAGLYDVAQTAAPLSRRRSSALRPVAVRALPRPLNVRVSRAARRRFEASPRHDSTARVKCPWRTYRLQKGSTQTRRT